MFKRMKCGENEGMNNLFGIQIYTSPLATMTVPVRKHKKRRNQTSAYHRRVQKKWVKRWGTKKEECAFFINMDALGLGIGQRLVMHPNSFGILRNIAP